MGLIIVLLFVAAMCWALWPIIQKGMNIRANDGDAALEAIQRKKRKASKKP